MTISRSAKITDSTREEEVGSLTDGDHCQLTTRMKRDYRRMLDTSDKAHSFDDGVIQIYNLNLVFE